MKLSILERIVINLFYPKESNLIDQTFVKDISNKISFSQDEIKEINLKFNNKSGEYTWKNDINNMLDIDFTKSEITFLKKRIDELDKRSKITQSMMSIIYKIKEQ